jgi:hypothetical protein
MQRSAICLVDRGGISSMKIRTRNFVKLRHCQLWNRNLGTPSKCQKGDGP